MDSRSTGLTSIPRERTTVSLQRQKRLLATLEEPIPAGSAQVARWQSFIADVPPEQTVLVEFFDALPLFLAGSVTSLRQGGPLEILRRTKRFGDQDFTITIKPVIVPGRGDDPHGRKEILAGEREHTLWRVLRKMASDKFVRRQFENSRTVPDGALLLTLYELRKRLSQVRRGLSIPEIREGLKVLAETPIDILNETTRTRIYAGPFISLKFVADSDDSSGCRTLCSVTLNDLAVIGILSGLYDCISYPRLMSLKTALSQWLYETIVRQFRQASTFLNTYDIKLSRIVRDGPMRPYAELRKAAEKVTKAIDDLQEQGIVALFPPSKKVIEWAPRQSRGRRAIADVTWTLYLSEAIINEIKSDNAAREKRDERIAACG